MQKGKGTEAKIKMFGGKHRNKKRNVARERNKKDKFAELIEY